jgi:hypothetical protein
MANRSFHKPLGALEIDVATLYGTVTFGATGAVSASTGKGITSVTRNSAGKYTVLLADTYNALLWADGIILDTVNSDPVTVGVVPRLYSQAVNNATPTVVFQFYDVSGGEVADPASGAVLYYKIEMRNSSVT